MTYADKLARLIVHSHLSFSSLLKSLFNEAKLSSTPRSAWTCTYVFIGTPGENSKKEVDNCDNSCNIYT